MYADPRHKNRNETKVRLDDEYEAFLESLATIHHTQKAVLAREILKSWIDEKREELTRSITAA
jgi:predicted DNA-binding protein